MANTEDDLILNVRGNTRGLESDIKKALNSFGGSQGASSSLNLRVNYDKTGLGSMTQDLTRASKALDVATQRVFSFGASLAVLAAAKNTLTGIVRETIEVEKALKDINVLLNLSSDNLNKFSKDLFGIAKLSASSFKDVSTAAAEFARQGLSVNETLARTKNAFILVRQTGLSAEEAVASLTAATQTFNEAGLTSTQILNKMAQVDASFAVSSKDLVSSIQRAGASAKDFNVTFEELLALVTSVKQQTAREGSVIGNGFKTIFTKLNTTTVIESLQDLGVAIDESQTGVEKLRAIAKGVEDAVSRGSSTTATEIKKLAAGQHHINTLSAALRDLSNNYSIFNKARDEALNASDEAYQRNEEQNKTLAASITRLQQNFIKLGSTIGEIAVKSDLQGLVDKLVSVSESVDNLLSGDSLGGEVLSAALKGIGNFLTGPGLMVGIKALWTTFKDISVFASRGIQEFAGLNKQSLQQQQLQAAINTQLQNGNTLLARRLLEANSEAAARQQIVNILRSEVALHESLNRVSGNVAAAAIKGGFSRKTFASGFVGGWEEEKRAILRGEGGARGIAQPYVLDNFSVGGIRQSIIANTDEKIVPTKQLNPNYTGPDKYSILTRDQQKGNWKNFVKGFNPEVLGQYYINQDELRKLGIPLTQGMLGYKRTHFPNQKVWQEFKDAMGEGENWKLFNASKAQGLISKYGAFDKLVEDIRGKGEKFRPKPSTISGDQMLNAQATAVYQKQFSSTDKTLAQLSSSTSNAGFWEGTGFGKRPVMFSTPVEKGDFASYIQKRFQAQTKFGDSSLATGRISSGSITLDSELDPELKSITEKAIRNRINNDAKSIIKSLENKVKSGLTLSKTDKESYITSSNILKESSLGIQHLTPSQGDSLRNSKEGRFLYSNIERESSSELKSLLSSQHKEYNNNLQNIRNKLFYDRKADQINKIQERVNFGQSLTKREIDTLIKPILRQVDSDYGVNKMSLTERKRFSRTEEGQEYARRREALAISKQREIQNQISYNSRIRGEQAKILGDEAYNRYRQGSPLLSFFGGDRSGYKDSMRGILSMRKGGEISSEQARIAINQLRERNSIGGRMGGAISRFSQNRLAIGFAGSMASGMFEQAASGRETTGAGKAFSVAGSVTNAAATGLMVGGPWGAAAAAGAAAFVKLNDVLSDSYDAVINYSKALEEQKDAFQRISDAMGAYRTAQGNMEAALSQGNISPQQRGVFSKALVDSMESINSIDLEKYGQVGNLRDEFMSIVRQLNSEQSGGNSPEQIQNLIRKQDEVFNKLQEIATATVNNSKFFLDAAQVNRDAERFYALDISFARSMGLDAAENNESLAKARGLLSNGINDNIQADSLTRLLANLRDSTPSNDPERNVSSLLNGVALKEGVNRDEFTDALVRIFEAIPNSKVEEVYEAITQRVRDSINTVSFAKDIETSYEITARKIRRINEFTTGSNFMEQVNGISRNRRHQLDSNMLSMISSLTPFATDEQRISVNANTQIATISQNFKKANEDLTQTYHQTLIEAVNSFAGTKNKELLDDYTSLIVSGSTEQIEKIGRDLAERTSSPNESLKTLENLIKNNAVEKEQLRVQESTEKKIVELKTSIEKANLELSKKLSGFGGNAVSFSMGDTGKNFGNYSLATRSSTLQSLYNSFPSIQNFRSNYAKSYRDGAIENISSELNRTLREYAVSQGYRTDGNYNVSSGVMQGTVSPLDAVNELAKAGDKNAEALLSAISSIQKEFSATIDAQIKKISGEDANTLKKIEEATKSIDNADRKIYENSLLDVSSTTMSYTKNSSETLSVISSDISKLVEKFGFDKQRQDNLVGFEKTIDTNQSILNEEIKRLRGAGVSGEITQENYKEKINLALLESQKSYDSLLNRARKSGLSEDTTFFGPRESSAESYRRSVKEEKRIIGLTDLLSLPESERNNTRVLSPVNFMDLVKNPSKYGLSDEQASSLSLKGKGGRNRDEFIGGWEGAHFKSPEYQMAEIGDTLANIIANSIKNDKSFEEELDRIFEQQGTLPFIRDGLTKVARNIGKQIDATGYVQLQKEGAGMASRMESAYSSISNAKSGIVDEKAKTFVPSEVGKAISSGLTSSSIYKDNIQAQKDIKSSNELLVESLRLQIEKTAENTSAVLDLNEQEKKNREVLLKNFRKNLRESSDKTRGDFNSYVDKSSGYSDLLSLYDERQGLENKRLSGVFQEGSEELAKIEIQLEEIDSRIISIGDNASKSFGEFNSLDKFALGFIGESERIYKQLSDLGSLGANVANQLSSGFANVFSDAITGSENLVDGLRNMFSSLFADIGKQMMQAGISKILSQGSSSIWSSFGGFNNGGYVQKRSSGGSAYGKSKVPTLLTGGEYVASPEMVHQYGLDFFKSLNSGSLERKDVDNIVKGGSGAYDDQFRMTPAGSYVINKANTNKYSEIIDYLNSGGQVKPEKHFWAMGIGAIVGGLAGYFGSRGKDKKYRLMATFGGALGGALGGYALGGAGSTPGLLNGGSMSGLFGGGNGTSAIGMGGDFGGVSNSWGLGQNSGDMSPYLLMGLGGLSSIAGAFLNKQDSAKTYDTTQFGETIFSANSGDGNNVQYAYQRTSYSPLTKAMTTEEQIKEYIENRKKTIGFYNSGGKVTGGSFLSDSVPASLTKGEFVIQSSAVNKYGSEMMREINEGRFGNSTRRRGFNTGGPVISTQSSQSIDGDGGSTSQNNASGGTVMNGDIIITIYQDGEKVSSTSNSLSDDQIKGVVSIAKNVIVDESRSGGKIYNQTNK